jgi:hypothetical protein
LPGQTLVRSAGPDRAAIDGGAGDGRRPVTVGATDVAVTGDDSEEVRGG